MKRQKTGFTWQLLLIGIPFAAFGLIALGLATWQITSHVRALGWVEHPATLLTLDSHRAQTRSAIRSRSSRLEGSYRYAWEGRAYVGERIAFSQVHAYGLDNWDENVADALGEPGGTISIWVNPKDPAESVVIRDMRWGEFGVYLIFAFGMGCGGVFFLSGAFARGGPPPKADAKPPRVKLKTVILMWLLAPLFGILAWLLWRDEHPVWAGVVGLQLLLTLNATYQYGVHQLARGNHAGPQQPD